MIVTGALLIGLTAARESLRLTPVALNTLSPALGAALWPKLTHADEVATPHGTITIVIDRKRGVMEIFAEHDPHPDDWDVAASMIMELCGPGTADEPDYLRGIDTWQVKLKS